MSQTSTELAESLHQFVTIWKLVGRPFPNVDQVDKLGLAITWPDTEFLFYNALFLTEQLTAAPLLEDRVQAAAAYMRSRSNTGILVVCLDNVSCAAKEAMPKILAQAKFVEAMPMTGMTGDILPLARPEQPSIRFKRILDEATILDCAKINCISYDVPVHTGRALLENHALWHKHAYGFIAYEGDKPVSTATAIITENCLYLFLVATMPEARRKGYADAVARHALQTAHEATGIRRTALHATDAGYPLYLRLGYHPTAKFMACMLET
ncbi:MAG: GNAT family N-acetyltransferase [Verrucomicrobia bacterium]|nr:GNAT family N-acetyltransferase [Verrucomicrobiota bacterium]